MAKQVYLSDPVRRRNRRQSGLPRIRKEHPGRRWWQRVLLWPGLYVLLASSAVFAWLLWQMWEPMRMKERDGEYGGIPLEILQMCALAAVPTVVVWGLIFVLIDRWKPQRFVLWFLAFGWGACVATYVSMELNGFMAEQLKVLDGDNEISQIRVAVYAAPFVEETAKAVILFLIVAALRHRVTTKLSIVSLAGLSAIGFAFTENILYYVRAYIFAMVNPNVQDPDSVLRGMQYLRGVLTSWGHWSFTTMTALGLAWGMRSRSKSVRILAPLAGFGMAVLGHMFFNSQIGSWEEKPIMITGIIMCFWLAMLVIGSLFFEGSLIRNRLTDYVRAGWARPRDPIVFSSLWRRWQMVWLSLFEGPKATWATIRMIRAMTELAYLRDSMTRGLIDDAGLDREKELFELIRSLRPRVVSDPKGVAHRPLWGRWRKQPRVVAGSNFSGAVTANPASTAVRNG